MELITRLKNAVKAYDDAHNFTCDLCGRELFANERICAPCRKALPWNDGCVCPFCGRKIKEEGVCVECKAHPIGVKKARSVFVHEGDAARLVVRFKRGEKYLYRMIIDTMVPLFAAEFSFVEGIVAVPMTEKAQKKRGYNQAQLLAEELAARTGVPFLDVLRKEKETPSQKFLSRRDREKNLSGCFRAERAPVKGKKLLIVDDTLTTGATISAVAAALQRAKAGELYALTVTSVENKTPFGAPEE